MANLFGENSSFIHSLPNPCQPIFGIDTKLSIKKPVESHETEKNIATKFIESELQKMMNKNIFEGLNQKQSYDLIKTTFIKFNNFYIEHINHKQKILEFLDSIDFEKTINILKENIEIKEYEFITDLINFQKIDYSDPFSAGSISTNINKKKKNGKSSNIKKKTNFNSNYKKISKKKGGELSISELNEIRKGDNEFIECAFNTIKGLDPPLSVKETIKETIKIQIKDFINNVSKAIKLEPNKSNIPRPYLIDTYFNFGAEHVRIIDNYEKIQMCLILKKDFEFCSIYEYIIDNILNGNKDKSKSTDIDTSCKLIQNEVIDKMREQHHRYIGYLRSEIISNNNNCIFFEDELFLVSKNKVVERNEETECIKKFYSHKIKESFLDADFIYGWNKCQEFYIKIHTNKDLKPNVITYTTLRDNIYNICIGLAAGTATKLIAALLGNLFGFLSILLMIVWMAIKYAFLGIDETLDSRLENYLRFFKKDAYIIHPPGRFKSPFYMILGKTSVRNDYELIERKVEVITQKDITKLNKCKIKDTYLFLQQISEKKKILESIYAASKKFYESVNMKNSNIAIAIENTNIPPNQLSLLSTDSPSSLFSPPQVPGSELQIRSDSN